MSISEIPNFDYHVPKTVQEVLELLHFYGSEGKVIAGGTDVIPKMKGGVMAPKHIISLREVRGLTFIDYDCRNGLTFGANTKLRALEANPMIQKKYKALYDGMHSIANTQIRNVGTVVGNICNAVPSADSAPPLLALEAKVKIASVRGERIVPIEDFFTGVCRTVLAPDELITEITLPDVNVNGKSVYYKYAIRKALDLAMVGVAVKLVEKDGVCQDIKIGLGAVAITPKRAFEGEEMLIGKKLTDELIDQVSLYISENECSPISDMRASKEYRRNMVRVLTRDAIKYCMEK